MADNTRESFGFQPHPDPECGCALCRSARERKARQAVGVRSFLAEVVELGRRYGFSLEHEDGHGAFLVREYNDDAAVWLTGAFDEVTPRVCTKCWLPVDPKAQLCERCGTAGEIKLREQEHDDRPF